jgi:AcrR family transcriptional regulator
MNDDEASSATSVAGKTGDRVRAASSKRRATIINALKRCIIEKGYAETTLKDLANAAKMSPSHLLYYYPNKEQVLLALADELFEPVFENVSEYRDESPEERIHVLVEFMFMRGVIKRSELSIVLEIVTLATHQPELRARSNNAYDRMLAYLTDLFEATPRLPGMSAKEAAHIAAANWLGLNGTLQFADGLNEGAARRLFRKTLFALANFSGAATDAGAPVVKPSKVVRDH